MTKVRSVGEVGTGERATLPAIRMEGETLRIDIYKPIPPLTPDQQARFWSHVSAGSAGCLNWIGRIDANGYGLVKFGGTKRRRVYLAHRIAYALKHGATPTDLPLDHLCRNHACVNAEHLEAVSLRVNALRGESPTAQNARKTTCLNGHSDFKEVRAGRDCRTCRNIRLRARRAAAKQLRREA